MRTTTVLTLALALGLALTTAAQPLTRAQQGRVELGKCYATCYDRAYQTKTATDRQLLRLADLLLNPEFWELSSKSRDMTFDREAERICDRVLDEVQQMDACNAGCVDIEAAYGVTNSQARRRFQARLTTRTNNLRAAGLWIGYDRIAPNFDAACTQWINGEAGQAVGAGVLRHIGRARESVADHHDDISN